jgi:hypothetical protein
VDRSVPLLEFIIRFRQRERQNAADPAGRSNLTTVASDFLLRSRECAPHGAASAEETVSNPDR